MAPATETLARERVVDGHAGRKSTDDDRVADECKPRSRHPSPDLRADAPAFVPQDKEFKLPPRVKTARQKEPKKDLYHVFDAVPFTPSQGVKTPSPNNMAALRWQMYSPFATPGHYMPDSPTTVLRSNFAPSDSSSNSDASATQVLSPVHPGSSVPFSPLMFYPVPINAGLPGYVSQDSHSPHGSPSPLMPGSPVSTPPGMRPSPYPFVPIHLATPPPGSTFTTPMDLHGRRGAGFPGQQFLQQHRLSRTHMYPPTGAFPHGHITSMPPGMAYQVPSHGTPNAYLRRPRPPHRSLDSPDGSDGPYSTDKTKFKPRKNNSEPKLGADGLPRLNARQRRTLRRAKERALKALMETGSKLLQKAGLGNLQLADLAGAVDDDSPTKAGTSIGTSRSESSSPVAQQQLPLSPEQCEANRAEAAAAVSQALAECSVEPSKNPVNLDSNNIADLIQQLSLKQDEGIVDEKLIRDLQIIQGLLGALKQTPVPSKTAVHKSHRSPGHRVYERPPAPAVKTQVAAS